VKFFKKNFTFLVSAVVIVSFPPHTNVCCVAYWFMQTTRYWL